MLIFLGHEIKLSLPFKHKHWLCFNPVHSQSTKQRSTRWTTITGLQCRAFSNKYGILYRLQPSRWKLATQHKLTALGVVSHVSPWHGRGQTTNTMISEQVSASSNRIKAETRFYDDGWPSVFCSLKKSGPFTHSCDLSAITPCKVESHTCKQQVKFWKTLRMNYMRVYMRKRNLAFMALCHKLDQAVVRWSMEEPARRNSLAVMIGNACNKRVENFNHKAQTFCLKAEKQKLITSCVNRSWKLNGTELPVLLSKWQGRQFTLFLYQRKWIQFIVWYFDRPPYSTFGRSL